MQSALTVHAQRILEIQAQRSQRILAIAPRTDLGDWNLSRKGQPLIAKKALQAAYDRAVAPLREAAA